MMLFILFLLSFYTLLPMESIVAKKVPTTSRPLWKAKINKITADAHALIARAQTESDPIKNKNVQDEFIRKFDAHKDTVLAIVQQTQNTDIEDESLEDNLKQARFEKFMDKLLNSTRSQLSSSQMNQVKGVYFTKLIDLLKASNVFSLSHSLPIERKVKNNKLLKNKHKSNDEILKTYFKDLPEDENNIQRLELFLSNKQSLESFFAYVIFLIDQMNDVDFEVNQKIVDTMKKYGLHEKSKNELLKDIRKGHGSKKN